MNAIRLNSMYKEAELVMASLNVVYGIINTHLHMLPTMNVCSLVRRGSPKPFIDTLGFIVHGLHLFLGCHFGAFSQSIFGCFHEVAGVSIVAAGSPRLQ